MLGEQIKALRKAQNISQVQLAEKMGVTKQSVSNWENNNILPSIEILKKLSQYFGCTSDYLLGLENDRTIIDVSGLTMEQISHIQQLVSDIEFLNLNLCKSATNPIQKKQPKKE